MIFKSDNAQGDLNGFLDAGSHMQGSLHFEDTFRVDGKFTGKVISKGDLVVGEHGEVQGELQVGRIFISGTVRGSIQASRRVELTASGKLDADVETTSLVIEEGATFDGRCTMVRQAEATEAAGSPAPAAPVVRRMPVPNDS